MSGLDILITFLAFFRHIPEPANSCISTNIARIAAQAEEGERIHGVPVSILLVVGFTETHLGCDNNEGGNWGAPISRFRRHVAGTHLHAANALRRSFEVCGDWFGAIARFRSGLCRPTNPRYFTSIRSRVLLIRRLHRSIGLELPDNSLSNQNRLNRYYGRNIRRR